MRPIRVVAPRAQRQTPLRLALAVPTTAPSEGPCHREPTWARGCSPGARTCPRLRPSLPPPLSGGSHPSQALVSTGGSALRGTDTDEAELGRGGPASRCGCGSLGTARRERGGPQGPRRAKRSTGPVGQSGAVLAEQEKRVAELPCCLGEEVGRGWASPVLAAPWLPGSTTLSLRFLSLGHACDPMS